MADKIKRKSPLQRSMEADFTTQTNVGAMGESIAKFRAKQGHGFAAEQANDRIDNILGKDAQIIGGDNAKNGADRLVNGQYIQTKYCQNASASVNAAFDNNGIYRYMDPNGKAMQLEVPLDQYSEAISYMRKKIENGKVPGVSNPDDAEKLVRKGRVTYKQAVQISKAGTIESLTFDAVNGVVIAANAMGITATIIFAKELWSGEDSKVALEKALYAGLQAGGLAFTTSVLTAQLMRTKVNNLLLAPSIKLVKLLPSNIRKYLLEGLNSGVQINGAAGSNNLPKLIRSNIISGTVLVLVISGPTCIEMFRGRVSAQQLFKQVMEVASGLCGGLVGAAAGSSVGKTIGTAVGVTLGPAGGLAGGIIGGTITSKLASKLLNTFLEDDAKKMVEILEEVFPRLVEEYLLSQEEVKLVLDELNRELAKGALLEMYASNDRFRFANNILVLNIQKIISWRVKIFLPNEKEIFIAMSEIMKNIECENNLSYLTNSKSIDTEKIAKELGILNIRKEASDKAWYVTKQVQSLEIQKELILQEGLIKDRNTRADIAKSRKKRLQIIDKFKEI